MSNDLEVLYIPDVSASLNDYFFCDGESQILNVEDLGDPTVTYDWNTGATSASIEVTTAGTYMVDVIGFCNTASAQSIITTDPCLVIIPNVFTPGGNGQNDLFVLDGLYRWPNTQFTVYNRWGTIMYHSNNYQNDWDGTNMNNNKIVSEGTYYYTVVYNDGETDNGFFTVFHE